jgi:hypothetical protein
MSWFNQQPKQIIEVVHKYDDSGGGGCCGCIGFAIGIVIIIVILVLIF